MAKRTRVKAARKKPVADATGQLLMLDPITGDLTSAARAPKLSRAQRQLAEHREQERKRVLRERYLACRAARVAWRSRRDAAVRSRGYRLPEAVVAFLKTLHDEPTFQYGDTHVEIEKVLEIAAEAYLNGCRQGYIEGRVADLEPNRERSRKANAAKRQRRQDCGGHMMTLDERDAAIVAEYSTLRDMLGSIEAQLRLAEKYGLSSREQVGNVIRKAKQNGTA